MPEAIGLTSLSVEGFRAFARRQTFDLAASAVIVTGSNGTGKTSFFDAVQWLLLGSIPRLIALRTKRTDEYILNEYTAPKPARVEAEMLLAGNVVNLSRTGNHERSDVTWSSSDGVQARGAEAEELIRRSFISSDSISLEVGLLTFGLLQQDVVRAVLHSRPSERYELLSRMLGLDRLEAFDNEARQNLERARKRRADATAEVARAKLRFDSESASVREVRLRAQASAPVEDSRQVLAVAAERAGVVVDDITSSADAARIAAHARALSEDLAALIQERTRADDVAMRLGRIDVSDLSSRQKKLEQQVATLRSSTVAAQTALARAQGAARDFGNLAALALPLLAESCPVCGQAINAEEVASRLRRRAPAAAQVSEAAFVLEVARTSLTTAEAELAGVTRAVSEREQLESLRDQSSIVLRATLDRLVGGAPLRISVDVMKARNSELVRVREGCIAVAEAASVLAAAMTAVAQTQDIPRREALLRAAGTSLSSAQSVLDESIARESRAKTLAQAARDARVAVMQQRFERLRPLIRDVYQRLDPHPTFREFAVKVDTYWQRGTSVPTVTDTEMGIEANPMLVFSSAQANITALAYFLSMGWASQRSSWPFVLLDDPLQSMDDVNALGFADLCRYIRSDRQLILSTHESRLAGLLERKLAPRIRQERTLVINFEGWERPGPVVDERQVEPQYAEGRPVLLATA
jgi:DNA repair exonuclease SbcCD ATPase subunit